MSSIAPKREKAPKPPEYSLAKAVQYLMNELERAIKCPFCSSTMSFLHYYTYPDNDTLEVECDSCHLEFKLEGSRSRHWTVKEIHKVDLTPTASCVLEEAETNK